MSNNIPKKFMLLVLCLAVSNSCKDKGVEKAGTVPSGAAETTTVIAVAEGGQDLTKLPHEAVNGLRLTAEVLDDENWIIGLTWENVGNTPLPVPMYDMLKSDIYWGYAAPFFRKIYGDSDIFLDKGKHADSKVFDITRDGEMTEEDAGQFLRRDWRLPGEPRGTWFPTHQYQSPGILGIGEKRTCIFRFPRYKSDEESGRWKKGDRIPVDFRYFVDAKVPDRNGVTLTSGENGPPPSAWRGEVFSNVVYLEWNSGGERVRWPSYSSSPQPAEPVNNLLLSLEIIDKEAWIVRLRWKNVGDTPLEVPVNGTLMKDIESYDRSRRYEGNRALPGEPFLFYAGLYRNFRYYGRPFGTVLDRGTQGDATFMNTYRDPNFRWDEKLLEKNGFCDISWEPCNVSRDDTEWIHLPPGEYGKEIDFKFPRYESDDGNVFWKADPDIPIEFCFKAGEILNSQPPLREMGTDAHSDLRRFPPWKGEVFSNVVFFRWTSEGERMKPVEPSK